MWRFALFLSIVLVLSGSVAAVTELSLSYDANGNLISGDGKYRIYNGFNQLWRVYSGSNESGDLLREYAYDPMEDRVLIKKSYVKGNVFETIYYFDPGFVCVVNSSGSYDYEFLFMNGDLVAIHNPDGTKYFINTDLHGNIVAVTNESGQLIETNLYTPYGELISGGTGSRYTFEGRELDSDTEEYDYRARMYNPNMALFVQPDPTVANPYDPQQLNRYSFERNNPLRNRDPTGKFIVGSQFAADAGMGNAFTGSQGVIYDIHSDLSYDRYSFVTFGPGGGYGASVGIEG